MEIPEEGDEIILSTLTVPFENGIDKNVEEEPDDSYYEPDGRYIVEDIVKDYTNIAIDADEEIDTKFDTPMVEVVAIVSERED